MASCVHCGTEFMARTPTQRYCSQPCANRAQADQKGFGAPRGTVRRTYDVRRCKQCEHPFATKTLTQEFCSAPCSGRWISVQRRGISHGTADQEQPQSERVVE